MSAYKAGGGGGGGGLYLGELHVRTTKRVSKQAKIDSSADHNFFKIFLLFFSFKLS